MHIKSALAVVLTHVGIDLVRGVTMFEPPFEPPPCTILSALYSAAPASVSSEIEATPSNILAYVYDEEDGHPQPWFTDLPDNVKSWMHSVADFRESLISDYVDKFSSALTNFPPIPSSILSELNSLNPGEASRYPNFTRDHIIELGYAETPLWYSEAPDDLKSWASSVGTSFASSFESEFKNYLTATASIAITVTATGACVSDTSTTDSADASATDSTDAAPAPTGNELVIGVAGAAGILGLALAL
ncbi:hypothetical protein VTN49DRAFT_1633 [Thermomyces lanuginosus]|uniref:uncharacterized protein n=1 Tax=Thermomyces lanuginosus TaxID=5541 RepID=UPI003742BCD3